MNSKHLNFSVIHKESYEGKFHIGLKLKEEIESQNLLSTKQKTMFLSSTCDKKLYKSL